MEKGQKIVLLLSLINALQFFVQGLWSMTLGLVLNRHGLDEYIKTAFFLLGIATIISPFFMGYISDKTTSPKKILSLLHILNSLNFAFLYISFSYARIELVLLFIFTSGVLFYPTTALISSLTFQNAPADSYFPAIRSFGTIGFIASGFYIGYCEIESSPYLYLYASVTSLLLAIVVFISPLRNNFQSKAQPKSLISSLGVARDVVIKNKAILVLFGALILMISQLAYSAYFPVYLKEIGFNNPTNIMQVAVFSELVFMLILPLLITKFNPNTLLIIGSLTYIIRNFILIINIHSYLFISLALIFHGISWVMFFIVLDVFIKRISLESNGHQMQSLKVILINGLGVAFASLTCGFVFNQLVIDGNTRWQAFWSFPLITSIVAFLMLLLKNKNTS